jgi:pilus assembly protein CpaC
MNRIRQELEHMSRYFRPSLAATAVVACLLAGSLAHARADQPRPVTLIPTANRAEVLLTIPENEEDSVKQIELETGKSIFIRTTYDVKRVSVGNPDVLDVVVLGKTEIQLVAKEIGTTNLLIWDQKGRPQAALDIHVGAPHSKLESELRRILGSSDIQVDSAGNGIVLSGSVPTAIAMDQALSIARAVLSEEGNEAKKVVNLLEVRGHHQVMLEVVIAEMSRTVRREFGMNFNAIFDNGDSQIVGLLQGLTSPTQGGGTGFSEMINLVGAFTGLGALTQLSVFLDVLDEKGMSKILAEPTLVARSGETASFLVGGEVPIPIAQGGAFGSITIEYKKFGVGVGFTPTVLGPDRIHIEVRPEVSEPDFSFGTTVDGTVVPGFNTRRASTAVELGDGQSFAIAGLLREDLVEVVGQYPIIGDIPILGALFRSSLYQKRETELVIIVTPRLVKPMPGGTHHQLPMDYFVEPSALEFYFLGGLEGRSGVRDADKPYRNFDRSETTETASAPAAPASLDTASAPEAQVEVMSMASPAGFNAEPWGESSSSSSGIVGHFGYQVPIQPKENE